MLNKVTLTVEGNIDCQALLDTGSVPNQISRCDLNRFGDQVRLDPSTDHTPIIYANGDITRNHQRVRLTGSFIFQGMRKVFKDELFLVLESAVHLPILIGNPLLEKLGIELQNVSNVPTYDVQRVNVSVSDSSITHLQYQPPAPFNAFDLHIREGSFTEAPPKAVLSASLIDWTPQTHSMNDIVDACIQENVDAFDDLIRRIKQCNLLNKRDRTTLSQLFQDHAALFAQGLRPEHQACMTNIDLVPEILKDGFNRDTWQRISYTPSPARAQRIREFLIELMAMGVIRKYSSRIEPGACPFHLIPGPNGDRDKDRLVVDTSRQRSILIKDDYASPTADRQIPNIAGVDPSLPNRKRCLFGAYDVPKAFYTIPYLPGDPVEARFATFDGCTFIFDRLIMGSLNSMAKLNRALDQAFEGISGLARVADDIRLGSTSISEHIERTGKFLAACARHNVPLKPGKCDPISTSTLFCGYQIDNAGFRPDPRSRTVIESMEKPRNGAQLASAIGVIRWMSSSIPDSARLLKPLQDILQAIYRKAGSAESSAAKRFAVTDFGWTSKTDKLWTRVLHQLSNAVTLHHRDPKKTLVLYTDASQIGWAGLLFQVDPLDLDKHPTERHNELLGCMAGTFAGSQLYWPIVELEGYAVKRSIERMYHIINDNTKLHIMSDNKNLESIFDPSSEYLSKKDGPGRGRLIRWAAMLNEIDHVIQHIPGESNVFADLISRMRSIPPEDPSVGIDPDVPQFELQPSLTQRINAILPLHCSAVMTDHSVRTTLDPDWVHPSIVHVRAYAGDDGSNCEAFANFCTSHGGEFDYNERVWKRNGKVIIPDTDLRVKLMVLGHCQGGGHRGKRSTFDHLNSVVWWDTLESDVTSFVGECIHCHAASQKVPKRPYGQPLRASHRNQVLSFDFLHLGKSEQGYEKILVLTDQLSGFSKFFLATSESARVVADAIITWISLFGVPQVLMSDQSTGFKNEVIGFLTQELHADHHFTEAHVKTGHGKQERLNGVLGDMFRKLVSENRLAPSRWPELVPIVQMAYNNTPTKALKDFAPIEVFLGLQKSRPLDSFFSPGEAQWNKLESTTSVSDIVSNLISMLSNREALVKEFQDQTFAKRTTLRKNARGVLDLVLEVGDYVMRYNDAKGKRTKLAPRWIGPAKVTAIDPNNPHRVTIQHLGEDKKMTLHKQRLKFFDHRALVTHPELKQHADFLSDRQWEIDSLVDIAFRNNEFYVQVRWCATDENPQNELTWEPVRNFLQDVDKSYLIDFLRTFQPTNPQSLAAATKLLHTLTT